MIWFNCAHQIRSVLRYQGQLFSCEQNRLSAVAVVETVASGVRCNVLNRQILFSPWFLLLAHFMKPVS